MEVITKRHFPLAPEQEASLKQLRESAKQYATSVDGQFTETLHDKHQKIIGQNTLRFVVQHTVKEQTGLSHWFDFNRYSHLDQALLKERFRRV